MKHFDDIIRGKLGALPPQGTPNWEALESQLTGESFDQLLRDGLEPIPGLEAAAATAPLGWAALNGKLDVAAELEGDLFDRMLSQRLAEADVAPAEPKGWQQLSHRMDTLWPLRKRLARYRILEIAAAVALLLTFGPLLRDNPVMPSKGAAATASLGGDGPVQLELSPALDIDLSVYGEPVATSSATVGALSRSGNTSTSNRSITGGSVKRTVAAQQSERSATFLEALPSRLLSLSAWALPTAKADQQAVSSFSTSASDLTAPREDVFGPLPRSSLPAMELAELPFASPNGLVPVVTAVSPTTWRVGAGLSALLWNIRTPVDQALSLSAASRRRIGLGVSVEAVRTLKPGWEMSLGVQVASVSYDPDLPLFIIENSVRNLDRIERFEGITTDIATVPVVLRRRIGAAKGNTRVFAKAGLAANVVLSTRYNYETSVGEFPAVSLTSISSSPGGEPQAQALDNSLAETRAFTPGLLTGGRLSSNAFASAVLGVELEHQANTRLAFHAGLDYNHFLGPPAGVGPNRDRLSNLGLMIGARLSL